MPHFSDWARREQGVLVTVDAPSRDSQKVAKWQNWDLPNAKRAIPVKPSELGTGAHFEVVADRAAVRAEPSLAAPVQGGKVKGSVVELFEWSDCLKWRRVVNSKTWLSGWMLLDHPQHGPLLRPSGLPFQVKPLEPLCVAVHERCLCDMRHFLEQGADPNCRDASGKTPLMLAAEAGQLESCLLLLEARADLYARVGDDQLGGTVLRYAQRGPTMAFLSALMGQRANPKDLAPALSHTAAKKLLKQYQPQMHEETIEFSSQSAAPPALLPPANPQKTTWPRAEKSGKYTVIVSSCAVRAEPNKEAKAVGARSRGSVVELYEFDSSRQWRRVYADGEAAGGWMLLEHEEFGPLLEPLTTELLEKCPQEVY